MQGIGDSFDNVREKLSWPHLYNFAKKLNFLLAIFALEQGGKGGARLRAVPYNKLNKFYVRPV